MGPDGDLPEVNIPPSDSELEVEEEAEWRRLRTPSPEPRNRSYELPEAPCVKSVLLATEPAVPCLPGHILQSQQEMVMPLQDPFSPTLCNVQAGASPVGSFTSATWRGLGQIGQIGQIGQMPSVGQVLASPHHEAKSNGSSSSKDSPFSDTWPAVSPIASGMTSRKTTATSFTQVEFFPEDVPFYQASMDAVSGVVTFTGVETMRPARGSEGHPHHCQAACKYVRKARGCKDGDNCAHCHLCIWKSSTCKQKKAPLRRQALESSIAVT